MAKKDNMMRQLTDAMRSNGSLASRLSEGPDEDGASGVRFTQMSIFIDDDTKMRLSIYKAKERRAFKDIALEAIKEFLKNKGY